MSVETNTDARSLLTTGLLIDGEWLMKSEGGTMEHENPATGRVQAEFPIASSSEIDAAIEAARRGLQRYASWTPVQRADALRRVAAGIRARSEELSRIGTLESGLLATQSRFATEHTATWFDYYAGWADKVNGETVSGASGFDYTIVEPVGVVAIILTWNSAAGSMGMKLAATLAAGCAAVVKPPELAPFSARVFGEICEEAGLPAGVVNIVPGGPEAGEALVRDPRIAKITFTGSPGVGSRIQAACAQSLTPLVLELGGKSANIVFDDADVPRALEVAVQGIVGLSGQVCVAPTRLLAQSGVYDRIVSGVRDRLAAVRVGDPEDSASMMGPLISRTAVDRVSSVVESARISGGNHLLGGERLGGELANGFYVTPGAFADVDPESALAQDEVFGPVLAITPFSDEDEAATIANNSPFGLAAYVHTRDLGRAHTIARQLDAGNIAINGGEPMAGPYAPFGGFKDSGYGKEGGLAGLLEFVRIKNVNIRL